MNENVINKLSQRIYSNEPTKSPIKDVLFTQSALGIASKRKDVTSFFSHFNPCAQESKDLSERARILFDMSNSSIRSFQIPSFNKIPFSIMI